ncbi:MAG: PKD domain-containing protein, partial [Promethearchaeota archaeon]
MLKKGSIVRIKDLLLAGTVLTIVALLFLGISKDSGTNQKLVSETLMPVNTKASIVHEPIFINGNAELDAFCAGNGTDGLTPETAHVIENYEISGDGIAVPIQIINTDRFLIIRNCTLENSSTNNFDAGILLSNCWNINISNCNVQANNYGIYLNMSSNITIYNTTVFSSEKDGIVLDTNSNFNVINQSFIAGQIQGNGILVNISTNNIIDSCFINSNTYSGIIILNSTNTTVVFSDIGFNALNGIYIESSNGTIIFSNTVHDNMQLCAGVFLSDGSLIYNNGFINNNMNMSPQADQMLGGINNWDNGTIGNYWSDYTTRYPAANDVGGIWDIPYDIRPAENAFDYKPLVNWGLPLNYPPLIINYTSYLEYPVGSTGNQIQFVVVDDNSTTGTYNITGDLIYSGNWMNDTPEYVNVDNLTQGIHYLNLIVWDFEGLSDYVNITINVTVPDLFPVADFYANATNIFVGDWVQFIFNGSEGDPPAKYYWDFCDGTNSSVQNPFKQYSTPGIYNVSLEIWDADNDYDYFIRAYYINVSANTPPVIVNYTSYLEYVVNTTGNQIFFEVNDWEDWFGTWNIVGNLTLSGNWTNATTEFVNVDGLPLGEHFLTLRVWDPHMANSSATIIINVTQPDLNPVADFYANVTSIIAGDWVQFIFNGSEGDPPAVYQWNFGDGSPTESTQNPAHMYTNPGIYNVTLEIWDVDNDYDNITKVGYIQVVANDPPVISQYSNTLTYVENSTGNEIWFIANDTNDLNGTWDITGNLTTSGSWINDSAVYVNVDGLPIGIHVLNLTVYDPYMAWASVNITINVTAPDLLPVAEFYANVTAIMVGGWVQFFFNGNEGNPPATYVWDFGDGGNDTVQNPIHQYTAPGMYDVTLDIWDADSDHDNITKQLYITVSSGNSPPAILNYSSYLTYEENSTNNQIWFTVTDSNDFNGTWDITGDLTTSGSWINDSAVYVNVDGLPIGIHVLNLTVYDPYMVWASVSVTINVTAPNLFPVADFYANTT